MSESRRSHPVSDIIASEYGQIVMSMVRTLNYWRERSGEPRLLLAKEVRRGKRKRTRSANRKGA